MSNNLLAVAAAAAASSASLAAAAAKCPGLYCGRLPDANATGGWSECGPCPAGYRTTYTSSECQLCLDDPSAYDWLYLGFMAVVPLILHVFSIDMAVHTSQLTGSQVVLHVAALLETATAAALTVLAFEPRGQLWFHSCSVRRLSDWYTLFHNPTPNYEEKLYCTQEAVYPLQTMVLVFYLLCIVLMMLVRPWLNRVWWKEAKAAVYSALYFLPILALLHAVAGGLIYYAFPYLSIIISMIANAAHFSMKVKQDMKSLVTSSVKKTKNTIIILIHWLLLGYGIVALHQHLAFLAFVPMPSIFYIVTVKFTNPGEMHSRGEEHSN